MDQKELEFRREIVAAARQMNASGLNQGTSGNISARYGDRMLITPSAIPYETAPEELALPLEGEYGSWDGPLRPSTEWRFHLDITRARPEVGAIVHAHSTYCTTLAICRKEIPACHYMIAASAAQHPLCRLRHLRHQGVVDPGAGGAEGPHLLPARQPRYDRDRCQCPEGDGWRARDHRQQYYLSLAIGGPVLLPESEIENVKERFKSYGLQSKEAMAVAPTL